MEQNAKLPNIVGEGGLFGFSGMDGETNSASGFVATWGSDFSLLFHTPIRRRLSVKLEAEAEVVYATGDACRIAAPSGHFTATYAAWHTLVGRLPEGAGLQLQYEDGTDSDELPDGLRVTRDAKEGDSVVLRISGERFAVCFGSTIAEAADRASAGIGIAADVDSILRRRLRIFDEAPALPDAGHQRLLGKCISVMKVNTLSPEGGMKQMWSTPDRVPHRHMWLWDTVFHSLAMNDVSPDISWQCLKTMLDTQKEDGMIAHQISVGGRLSVITQPPVLAWGVWENYRKQEAVDKLAYALPILENYLEWDMRNRDVNGNGLLEWHIEGNVNCRSGESGMDNSSRFDEALTLDAVDFSTFMALEMDYVAQMASELGLKEKAAYWSKRARELGSRIVSELWDERDGFFYDKHMDGTFSRVKAVSGFLPLLLKELPAARTECLVGLLRDPEHFGTAYPVPSLAVSDPLWGTDMWRGPTWINLNYLIIKGLRLQGREEEADRLTDRSIELVDKYYRQYGVTFEYYDAKDERPPVACDRKGPVNERYDIRVKVDSIRDYHWTAALTACMLRQKYGV
ncbi:MAG: hypothetical protein K0Q94_5231 [Paenibacillus sp.]|nr:hypothetical protein [Paenibacillus sp.]